MAVGFIAGVFLRLGDIVSGPFADPLMLWEIAPLLLTMVVIELYFGRYRKEMLGWNSSVSNSLVLVFVGSNLLHYLFLEGELDFSAARSIIPVVLIGFGLLLFALNYFHKWPHILAFGISRSLIINILSLAGIVVVHLDLPLDVFTLLATLALLFVAVLVFFVVHLMQTPVEDL
jgi:hypothetical protein